MSLLGAECEIGERKKLAPTADLQLPTSSFARYEASLRQEALGDVNYSCVFAAALFLRREERSM